MTRTAKRKAWPGIANDYAALEALSAELLAALKFFVETDDVETALEKARAAIAKAEGAR